MVDECQKLRGENTSLHQKSRMSINIREHEDQMKHLTINNKQLTEKLDVESFECKKHLRQMENEMEEMRMKLGKRDMQITQVECENKVLKKMIRKYEDLVHGLRRTVRITFIHCTYFYLVENIFWKKY